MFPRLLQILQVLALALELLDPRECRYVLAQPAELATDLKMLRERCQDLDGAPPLADVARLPARETMNELLAFNRAWSAHLDQLLALEATPPRAGRLWAAKRETDRLYEVWDLMRDAQTPYYYVTVRRQALLKLRAELGADTYAAGRWPPHVPLELFVERSLE